MKKYIEKHQKKNSIKAQISEAEQAPVKSIFIKEGLIKTQFIEEPYYSFENFSFIRNEKNKPKLVGQGAFGEVYLSESNIDKKKYVIKHIKKSKVRDTGFGVDVVYREISIHRMLKHPNIVNMYSYKEDNRCFFMLLEYMNNGTLFRKIRDKKGFDENQSFHFFIQVVSAIYFLHSNGYAHRDIKPENILLDEKMNCKLTDFGWCVDLSEGLRGTFCGTYEYMAPEIISEVPYDQAIDCWSLGVLLYELLHGFSPFRAINKKEANNYDVISQNILKHQYKIEKPGLSNECADLIHGLLEPEHNKRMRVSEIFSHPWVLQYEKKINENNFKIVLKDEQLLNANKLVNQLLEFEEEKKPEKKPEEKPEEKKIEQKANKPVNQNPFKEKKKENEKIVDNKKELNEENNEVESDFFLLKESIRLSKNSLNEALNKQRSIDMSNYNDNNGNSLEKSNEFFLIRYTNRQAEKEKLKEQKAKEALKQKQKPVEKPPLKQIKEEDEKKNYKEDKKKNDFPKSANKKSKVEETPTPGRNDNNEEDVEKDKNNENEYLESAVDLLERASYLNINVRRRPRLLPPIELSPWDKFVNFLASSFKEDCTCLNVKKID